MISIPDRLKTPELRFYLVRSNGKIPIEKNWNESGGANYSWMERHLRTYRGNYGVVCGIGKLVVLDFDDLETYEANKHYLPPTFTVRTATKRLPHLYYYLKGKMISRSSIRDEDGKTLVDVQGARSGVVGPGSVIGRKFYDVELDIPIATISRSVIEDAFLTSLADHSSYSGAVEDDPVEIAAVMRGLETLGIQRTGATHFTCPFHESRRGESLTVFAAGALHCFHCERTWQSFEDFAIDYSRFKNG